MVSESWRALHSGARVGVGALGNVRNAARQDGLEARREALEASLRARVAGWSRPERNAVEGIKAYNTVDRGFGKTYHGLLPLDSVAVKGKPLASASALVQAMGMAEVESQLLMAGHDVDAIVPPLTIAGARGEETSTRLNGQPQALKLTDRDMVEARAVIASVIYGPDQRTRITDGTRRVLFVPYAPEGVEEVALRHHLAQLEE